MERLTYTNKSNGISVPRNLVYNINMDRTNFAHLEEIVKKLAYYEDLEESGKLPILYIGDNIYFRVKGRNQFAEDVDFIQTQKISKIDIDQNGILYCTASVKFIATDNIGKTVFLTREEAELKLKEMK